MIQFVLHHGQAVIFLAVLAEQVGIPLPSAPILLAAGALIGMGLLHPVPVVGVAVLASLVADFVWYELGVRRGDAMVHLLCRIALEPDTCVRRTQDVYRKYGAKSLLFGKWVPGLSTVAPPLAGAFGLRRWRFLAFDGLGSAMWAGSYVFLGWLFRSEIEWLAGVGDSMGSGVLALLGGLLAVYIGWKYLQRRRIYRELRVARISAAELKRRLDGGEDVLVIDYRHPSEWPSGMIPGAIPMRPEDLERESPHLVGGREVVLYCS